LVTSTSSLAMLVGFDAHGRPDPSRRMLTFTCAPLADDAHPPLWIWISEGRRRAVRIRGSGTEPAVIQRRDAARGAGHLNKTPGKRVSRERTASLSIRIGRIGRERPEQRATGQSFPGAPYACVHDLRSDAERLRFAAQPTWNQRRYWGVGRRGFECDRPPLQNQIGETPIPPAR
jgi:hypothetical protein